MSSIHSYLTFNGNCREAMEFYHGIFGGDLNIRTFGDTPEQMPGSDPKQVMHAFLHSGDLLLMASDLGSDEHSEVVVGTNVTLSIDADTKSLADAYFQGLSNGGQVIMPMGDTFWGAYFGMLTDRFGVQWMVSFNNAKTPE